MGRNKGQKPKQTLPEYPQDTPPKNLYATSDIRFVMLEIGKLTTNVERLISDVGGHNDKLDKLCHHVSWLKGAGAVLVTAIAAIGWIINNKSEAIIEALKMIEQSAPK